ncbi:MAG: hypothetical protein K8T26_08625 [Lentisphaerae bacterium]|nr:hypothetical protein [Lentisphaerota bacterium]
MAVTLSGRERVVRALERRDHDRVPRHETLWPETIARWREQGLDGDADRVRERLGSDLAFTLWSWPVPFPGREDVLEETDETKLVRGPMGKIERLWKHKSGTPEHVSFDCSSREKWLDVYKPALQAAPVHIELDKALTRFKAARAKGRFTYLAGIESFEGIRQLMGDVVTLMGMVEEPDWIQDMSQVYTDLILRDFQAAVDAGVTADAVWVFGDMGYNSGPFFAPAMYRDIIWPDHRRIGDWAKARGMKYIYHTDGDVRQLIPILLEAGIDCLQPLEAKACMDIRELVPKYQRRVSYFGNMDMTVMLTNDRAALEAEVRAKLAAGMSIQGYIAHSDHSVPPQVTWDTYQFYIQLLDQYGNYAT